MDGQINSSEFVLLGLVDVFTDFEGVGCWLSKRTLAKWLNKSSIQIQRILTRLRRTGLLIQDGEVAVGKQQRAVWVTRWEALTRGDSVLHPPREGTPNPYTDSLRSSVTNNEPEACAAGSGPPKEENVGFAQRGLLADTKKVSSPEKVATTQTAKELAKQHRQWCANQQHWNVSRQTNKWERPFQTLLNQVGKDRTVKCLLWYHSNHGQKDGQFRMRLRSGKDFREHFGLLEDFIEKQERNNPIVTMTDQGTALARKLADLKWPKGTTKILPAAVQITLDSWKAFRKKLWAYCQTHPKQTKHRTTAEDKKRFRKAFLRDNPGEDVPKYGKYYLRNADGHVLLAYHLLQVLEYSVPVIVENHFRRVFDSVVHWENWSGNLLSRAWRGDLDDKEFNTIVGTLAVAYSGGNSSWDKLKEDLA